MESIKDSAQAGKMLDAPSEIMDFRLKQKESKEGGKKTDKVFIKNSNMQNFNMNLNCEQKNMRRENEYNTIYKSNRDERNKISNEKKHNVVTRFSPKNQRNKNKKIHENKQTANNKEITNSQNESKETKMFMNNKSLGRKSNYKMIEGNAKDNKLLISPKKTIKENKQISYHRCEITSQLSLIYCCHFVSPSFSGSSGFFFLSSSVSSRKISSRDTFLDCISRIG